MQKAFEFSYEDQYRVQHHCAGACTIEYDFREDPKRISGVSVLVDGQDIIPSAELLAEIESRVITGCPAYKAPVRHRASNAVEVAFTALIGEASEVNGQVVTVFEEVEL